MRPSYIPKDIEGYEERIIAGLTGRQVRFGLLALVFGLSFYLITTFILHLPSDIGIYGCLLISFCIFYCGWAKWQGTRPFSEHADAILRFYSFKQIVIYSNGARYFRDKEDFYANKKRKNKSVNEQSNNRKQKRS